MCSLCECDEYIEVNATQFFYQVFTTMSFHDASALGDYAYMMAHLSASLLRAFLQWIYSYLLVISTTAFGIIFSIVLYKAYFNPPVYKKELTDVGFDHLPKDKNWRSSVERVRQARHVGHRLPPPYPNGWYAVAESRNLKTGDVMSVDALGQNWCVFRDSSGSARCVDAYCPHLGANMGVGGTVVDDCIECPFHKWRFDAKTGTCIHVPGDEPPRGVKVRTWPVLETEGAVWVWFHADSGPPLWAIEMPHQLRRWAFRGRNEFIVNCHIQDIPENAADVAHLNVVHSPSLLGKFLARYPLLLKAAGQHVWTANWNVVKGHLAQMRLVHDYGVRKIKLLHMDITITQIGPAHVRLMVRTAFGPMFISQSILPLSPMEQRVVHRIYSPSWNAPIAMLLVWGESYMFERDMMLWNHKTFMSTPTYVKTDKSIKSFRNWFAQFYSESSMEFEAAYKARINPLDCLLGPSYHIVAVT